VPEIIYQYVTSHPGQLSLAIPLWVGTISTSQRAMMTLAAGELKQVWFMCGWQVKWCDPVVKNRVKASWNGYVLASSSTGKVS